MRSVCAHFLKLAIINHYGEKRQRRYTASAATDFSAATVATANRANADRTLYLGALRLALA